MSASRSLVVILCLACLSPKLFAQKEFGFDNRKPSGQPYLPPEETVKRMKVAEGFEVALFAAEPMVVNPIAMTVDERGRVWCIECFEYPKRTAKGSMPRDRIVILEDTDNDGKADKRTVFAEGKDFPLTFDMASGLEVGHGGVFVGAPPYLWFIENKNDKPGKFEVLLKGFGSQDTHETLNTFQWGPDGRLYGLHGVFTHSEVKPEQADGPATRLNAAVWRYDVRTRKFEVFAEGTSNPWGLDWRNTDGQFILCCCVIPHLFHMSPGGIYKRQAGSSFHPYAYSYLNEICDHTFHRESGWAHAGLISLDTPHIPEAYRDSVIFGSIHGCSIKRNVLKKNGSTYTASRADDFLVSGDKNFRPINLRWGHNGEIYCIDWHDQNPCHQTPPDNWDYERGRVYRIQVKGTTLRPAEDLSLVPRRQLATMMADQNPWKARTASRLLTEQREKLDAREIDGLRGMVTYYSLKALGVLGASGQLSEELATGFLTKFRGDHPGQATLRGWTVRLLGERADISDPIYRHLVTLAEQETSAEVRRDLASTILRLSPKRDCGALLHALASHREDARDAVIPQLVWLAFEQRLTSGVKSELDWLQKNATDNALVGETLMPRTLRRLAASAKKEDLDACVAFVQGLKAPTLRRLALDGLTQGLQNRQVDEPAGWKAVFAELMKDSDGEVQRLARRLAVNFQDREAARRALALARDTSKPATARIEALRDVAIARPAEGVRPLMELVTKDASDEVRVEACRALSGYDGPDVGKQVPEALLPAWKRLSPVVRVEAVNLLAGRREWANALLGAVGKNVVPRLDLNDNTILRIRAFKDNGLNQQIEKVWGTFRDTPAELNALIDRMRKQLDDGRPSFARGQKVFEAACAKCHKFEGKGSEVGPNLDGAGRDVEYLLANVLDPNRVVGQPYFTRLITLKNGRVESGLLHAEDDQTVTLKTENDQRKAIPRSQIEEIQVSQKSVMPEGLTNAMKPEEFRDLVRYLMLDPYLTEVEISMDQKVWKSPDVGVTGRIGLPASKSKTTVYLRARVQSPGARTARLQVAGNGLVRAWVNGSPVSEGQSTSAGIEMALRESWNEIQMQFSYQGERETLAVRFHDPQRSLRYPEPGRSE